jgi:NAD dependent epimerase/dehydratase family enzyme
MKKELITEMRSQGPEEGRENSFIERASEKLSRTQETLHDALVLLSGNPIEKDPLVLQDNQGRERVATMQKNANKVSKRLKQAIAFLAAMSALSTLNATSEHGDKAARPAEYSEVHQDFAHDVAMKLAEGNDFAGDVGRKLLAMEAELIRFHNAAGTGKAK